MGQKLNESERVLICKHLPAPFKMTTQYMRYARKVGCGVNEAFLGGCVLFFHQPFVYKFIRYMHPPMTQTHTRMCTHKCTHAHSHTLYTFIEITKTVKGPYEPSNTLNAVLNTEHGVEGGIIKQLIHLNE